MSRKPLPRDADGCCIRPQGNAVADPKSYHRNDPVPPVNDLPPAPPAATLQRRYDMLSYRMMALGEGDVLVDNFINEFLAFSDSLVRFVAAGIDRPIGSYAPEMLTLIVKYENLLAR